MRLNTSGSIPVTLFIVFFLIHLASNAYSQIPEQSQFKTRNLILASLSEYQKSKACGQIEGSDSLLYELKWQTDIYQKMYGVRDLSIRLSIYEDWERDQAQKKLSLDSLYINWLRSRGITPTSEQISQLKDLKTGYSSINDSFQLAVLSKCRAQLYEGDGDIDSAIYYYRDCIEKCRGLDYYSLMGNCEMLLGLVNNYRIGDYLQSELAYSNAIKHFRKVDEQKYIPFVQLGRVYDFLQLYKTETAIRLMNSLLPELEKSNDRRNQAQCYYFLAVAYNNLGMLDSALFYGGRALSLRENISSSQNRYMEDLGYSMTYMGQIFQALGDREQALEMFHSADSVLRMAINPEGISTNLIAWGNYLLEIEEYNAAKTKFDNISQFCESYEIILSTAYGLAVSDYHLGNTQQAMERLKHCVWLIENTNRKLPVPEMKTGILSDKIGYFNLLACMYIRQFTETEQSIYIDSALQYMERSKSRALIENLMMVSEHEIDSIETRILSQISDIHKSACIKNNPGDALNEIHDLEDSLLMLYVESSNFPGDSLASFAVDDISIRKIQNHFLDSNTVLLQYLLSHFGNYVFIICKDSYVVVSIDSDYQTLQNMIREYLDLISSYPDGEESLHDYRRLGGELYSILIPDEALCSADKNHILIVASGPLHYLPVESLIDHNGNFLIENYNISYAPSVSAFDLISHREYVSNGTSRIIAFANSPAYSTADNDSSNGVDVVSGGHPYWNMNQLPPLVSCNLEVEAIEECFGAENSFIYTQGYGTEDNFKQVDYKSCDYLHISAHGVTDERNPDRSAILLASGDSDVNDGFLRPREILQLHIPARLVFLSSCRSGTGKSFPGEGVMSLARPFLIAGCQSAIATYWNISDLKSAEFVKHFYSIVRQGHSHSEALALAKRKFINSRRDKHRHPYFWAPYILIGQ